MAVPSIPPAPFDTSDSSAPPGHGQSEDISLRELQDALQHVDTNMIPPRALKIDRIVGGGGLF